MLCLAILLSAPINQLLVSITGIIFFLLLFGVIARALRVPYLIAYIIAGFVLGSSVLGWLVDVNTINALGEIGLILLLFFIGMEINISRLISSWKISLVGTLVQVLLFVLVCWLIGYFFSWPINRIITIGFALSLSSTAVVLKLIEDFKLVNTDVGQNAIGILLIQDILIVPMLLTIEYLNPKSSDQINIIPEIIGGIFFVLLIVLAYKKKEIRLPFQKHWESDAELQTLVAFITCFGMAILSAFFGLSSALGAFVAGIVVSASRSEKLFKKVLHSNRVLFVAVFFLYVGAIIDFNFIVANWKQIGILLIGVFIIKSVVNTFALHLVSSKFKESLFTGALLAQIGEFSFVLGEAAFRQKIINNEGYQLLISSIAISLILTPLWIIPFKQICKKLPQIEI